MSVHFKHMVIASIALLLDDEEEEEKKYLLSLYFIDYRLKAVRKSSKEEHERFYQGIPQNIYHQAGLPNFLFHQLFLLYFEN